MPIPFFVIFAAFCLVLMYLIKRNNRQREQQRARFWQREAEADNVRKQDISHLDYIYIPVETLPFGIDTSPEVQRAEATIRELDNAQILNLNRYTNTDLKMEYGVANLPFLSQCDERFILLSRTLYQWACLLLEHGHPDAAIQVAQYCIDIGSDISGCYYMLADYYRLIDDTEALDRLRQSADGLTGLNASSIKEYLNKSQE